MSIARTWVLGNPDRDLFLVRRRLVSSRSGRRLGACVLRGAAIGAAGPARVAPVRTRCRHCGIFFLTHPRNAGRGDWGCPFGCRQAHRRRRDNQRTAAYYREEAGRDKKQALNAKRRKRPTHQAAPPPASTAPPLATGPSSSPPPRSPPPVVDGLPVAWPRTILVYLQIVTGLIERRPVSLTEVVAMLLRALRQHRMVRTR